MPKNLCVLQNLKLFLPSKDALESSVLPGASCVPGTLLELLEIEH